MLFKLCYLYTFILTITNMLNITHLGWSIVFIPSCIAFTLEILLVVIGMILAYVVNRRY